MMDSEPKHFLIQGDVYEVEKLVGVKLVKGKKLYRVRWRGYGRESDTLEPEENLLSCKDMILDLEEKLRERDQRKKNKKSYRSQNIIKDSKICVPYENGKLMNSTDWQATEVQPGPSLKDTFWRDFNEGKINVSDQDMYSKVKERASRTFNFTENGKSPDNIQKENPILPVCPKVVLKRKPCNRTSPESLTYKSSLKVKPVSMHIRKRKKYDVLRDYRKRKSRNHRKRNLDENRRHASEFRNLDKADGYDAQNNSNILQELLINDDQKSSSIPEFVVSSASSSSDAERSSVIMSPKDMQKKCVRNISEEGEKKNQPLMCRITIQDKSKAICSYRQEARITVDDHYKSTLMVRDLSNKKIFSNLLEATAHDQVEKVERICSNNSVVNYSQEDGTTALMIAAKMGFYNVARALLKANAHKDKQNTRGETALMMACRYRHPKIAKLLLEHGANFALTNEDGANALRITNQYAGKTILHGILVEHIMRIVSEFEMQARCVVEHIADIKYALFPIQCFSLNEGPKYFINFHHHVKLESPGKSGKQNLLFIANANIKGNSTRCVFDADPLVHSVCINGVKQDLFHKGEYSVFKMSGLQNGNNKVSITTLHYPESEIKLIVCAYRVHRSTAWFPAQKLKSEFLD